eukprot:s3224_g3.t1
MTLTTSTTTTSGGSSVQEKPESGGGATAELLHEATKLLKSLHIPAVKMISLKEVGDLSQSSDRLMLLDSGATHSLRRARTWKEWDEATETVVALAQGTTSKLRLKPGTSTLLATPSDDSFGNGIWPMGALIKLGYDVQWSGGDCKLSGPDGMKISVEVVDGCPMIERERGMAMIDELERDSCVATARMAMVKAILQCPELLAKLPDLDPSVLFTIFLKKGISGSSRWSVSEDCAHYQGNQR